MERIIITDSDDFVEQCCVQDLRDKAGTDPLNAVRTGGSSRKYRRGRRFDGGNLEIRIVRPEQFTNSGNGTSCADSCHQSVNWLISHGADNFGGRCPAVCFRI